MEDLLGRGQTAQVALAGLDHEPGVGEPGHHVLSVGEGDDVVGVAVPPPHRHLHVAGLPEDFCAQWADNHGAFPRGVDVVLATASHIAGLPLPEAHFYPGGRSRIQAQIAAAQTSHARRFGAPPVGIWPAEGAVSAPFVQQLAASGVRWAASG